MGLVLMAMSIGGLFIAIILLVISFWKKIDWLKEFIFGGVAVWFALYAVFLFGSSLSSEEKTLHLNEPKEFCGFYLDCHIQTAVMGVRKTKTIGDKTAKGEFYIVKVKVFSNAKRVDLGLYAPKLSVTDADGKAYPRVEDAEDSEPPLDQKIPAGGSFEREVVFDLPADVKNPRLDMGEGNEAEKLIETVLIGDEDSVLHERVLFSLESQTQTAKF